MRALRASRALLLVLAVTILGSFILILSANSSSNTRRTARQVSPGANFDSVTYTGRSSADINRVTNSTLGFAKILVVGLPERTDKRDALSLMSSITGFQVDWVAGVKPKDVPDKARPAGYRGFDKAETYIGSWRAHMNAVRRIVDEGLSSALIMEDDMDWDVHLKPQLEQVAKGARVILPPTPGNPPHSPYGDNWDLLWIGHCGEPFPEDLEENRGLDKQDPGRTAMSRKYTIADDPTVPPLDKITGLVKFGEHAEHTRWVHVTAAPICTFAYALSQRGARKVLFSLGIDGIREPYDNALAGMCRRSVGALVPGRPVKDDGGLGIKCLSVTPPVFFHHRAKGPVSGDSDINVVEKDDRLAKEGKDASVREKGSTENIVWSMRLNLANLLMGRPLEPQW